jgi:hypothetical protein
MQVDGDGLKLDCAPMTRPRAHSSPFCSRREFRELMDRTFALMSDDPVMGPRLREADCPQQFKLPHLGMVVNIRSGGGSRPVATSRPRSRSSRSPSRCSPRYREMIEADYPHLEV